MSAYTVFFRGEQVMRFHMDAPEGDESIYIEDEVGDFEVAVFQAADAQHDPETAASMLNEWLHTQGGAAWPVGRHFVVERDDGDGAGDEE